MVSKTCTKCHQEKSVDAYYKKTNGKHGVRSICKSCAVAEARAWNVANAEKVKARSAASWANDKDRMYQKRKEWGEANKERLRINQANWRRKNRDRSNQIARESRSRHKFRVFASNAERRAICKLATPLWANKKKIAEKYKMANELSKSTGIKWSVDHIVPLISELVCGLHVEHNLDVIPLQENITKQNFYWPNMP